MKRSLHAILLVTLALCLYIFVFKSSPQPEIPVQKQVLRVETPARKTEVLALEQKAASEITLKDEIPKDSEPSAVKSEIHSEHSGQVGKAPLIYSNAEQALSYIITQGQLSPEIIKEFSGIQDECSWCRDFYINLSRVAVDPSRSYEEREYAAILLSSTGNIDAAKELLKAAASDPGLEPRTPAFEAIAKLPQNADVVSLYDETLKNNDNPKLRKAIIAGLTYSHTLDAAKALYEDLIKNDDTSGFSADRIGLSYFRATPEVIPYLSALVMKKDKYSALPFRALLNSGDEGTSEAIEILKANSTDKFYKKLAVESPGYILRYVESYEFIESIEGANNLKGNAGILAGGIRALRKLN